MDPQRRDLFERFLPESQRRKVLGEKFTAEELLATPGNADHGKMLFNGVCAACQEASDTARRISGG